MRGFEIVGLDRGNNGRHCDIHQVIPCGSSISVGDNVILQHCALENGEDAVRVRKVENNCLTCCVAFLPRALLKAPFVNSIVGKEAQVIELYKDKKSTYKRFLDHQNRGQALVKILD